MIIIKREINDLNITVIGGGNGGQSTAGHIGMMGFNVKLYDIFSDTTDRINAQGGIHLEGAINGFGKIQRATTNIEEALRGANLIIITVPSTAHNAIAKTCAPHLVNGQIILLNPAATLGSLAFKKVLGDENCRADITIAETNTLLYGCRLIETGRTHIFGVKNRILTAALPASRNHIVLETLKPVFPQVEEAESVLVTSFDNTNPILHPAPTLLCTGLIESSQDWLFYIDGYTPSIGRFVEKLDKERLAIADTLNLKLLSCQQQLEVEYDVFESNLSEAIRQNKVYKTIGGQKSLDTRYLTEDIPMGLVPFASIGKMLGISVKYMELIIELSEALLEKDLSTESRTVDQLGIQDMKKEDLIRFIMGN